MVHWPLFASNQISIQIWRQFCTLLFTLEEDAEEVISSTDISKEADICTEVMVKLDKIFKSVIDKHARMTGRWIGRATCY